MPVGDVIVTRYTVLFQVKVLHHYLLDFGKILFDNLSSLEKIRVLAEYNVRNMVKITPDLSTQRMLRGRNMIFKLHGLGFAVLCEADASGAGVAEKKMEVAEKMRFSVTITDPQFRQYTAGFLNNEEVRTVKSTDGKSRDRSFKKIYHLKNDATGQSLSLAALPTNYEAGLEYAPESIVQHDPNLDGKAEYYISQRLIPTGTPPTVASNQDWLKLEQIAPQNDNVCYMSKADLMELEIGEDLPQDVFALIEIVANAGTGVSHLYDIDSNLKSPTFEVRFKNRLTWWRHSLPPWVGGPLTRITQPEILPLTLRGKQKIDLTFQVEDGNNSIMALDKKGVEQPSKQTPVLPEIFKNGTINRLLSDIYI